MKKDPFYRKIVAGLEGTLDPDTFEHCAADLIRSEWKVVPVRGGQDAGMDGAVADGLGDPYPLVCTTGADVIGNLTKNLESYLADGNQRRNALLVTSQPLTARKRKNLLERAAELGFTLVQIYDQTSIADRLYRDSAWCRELLGITGAPPALSALPLTTRLMSDGPLIGREEDLAWLRLTSGDCLLLGAPGCGKTSALHALAKEGKALFVVDDNRERIAEALRDALPDTVIVDDLHVRLLLLVSLLHMRRELGLKFAILGSGWPGKRQELQSAMGIPDSSVRMLELLTRDQMVQAVQAAGIHGPVQLIREIVDQSEGRPGLAATFARLCLQGDVRAVLRGDVLARQVALTFEQLVGQEAVHVLATLSVGGEGGMPMEVVAQALGMPPFRVQQVVTGLAAGGVIREARRSALAVGPAALRRALVRDTFFGGAISLSIQPLLSNAPSHLEALKEMIGVREVGGIVPRLEEELEREGSPALWQRYAGLGEREVRHVLALHPELAVDIAEAGLHFAPGAILPLLLSEAVGDRRRLSNTTEHPLREIQDWIRSGVPGRGQAVERRLTVAAETARWIEAGGDTDTGLHALSLALSPSFESTSLDPGLGTMLTWSNGSLTVDELYRMQEVWRQVASTLGGLLLSSQSIISSLHYFLEALHPWVYPQSVSSNGVPPEAETAMRALAAAIIGDLVPYAEPSRAALEALRQRAEQVGVVIHQPADADFATLFPPPANLRQKWKEYEEACRDAVIDLADRWSALAPEDVSRWVAAMEREVNELQDNEEAGTQWTTPLFESIAKSANDPLNWLAGLVREEARAEYVAPFLQSAVSRGLSGWETAYRKCLLDERYCGCALWTILMHAFPAPSLVEEASVFMPSHWRLIQLLCTRGQVPDETLLVLLNHPDNKVAAVTAVGIWNADKEGEIPPKFTAAWRSAILEADPDDYALGKILTAHPALVPQWLERWFQRLLPTPARYDLPDWLDDVVNTLSDEERIKLIGLVPPKLGRTHDIASLLVGRDPVRYAVLLARPDLASSHMTLLSEADDDSSRNLIPLALSVGYSEAKVASAILFTHDSWSGPESLHAEDRRRRFATLAAETSGPAKAVFEILLRHEEKRRNAASEEERREAVYGRST